MIPNTKVFIGSLPPGAKPQELRRLFENFGVVTECDIMNRCGFVHMESAEVAEKAIQGLNNSYFMGQAISVEPGRMKERRPPMGGRGGGEGGEERAPRGRGGPPAYNRGGGDGYSNGFQPRGGPSSRSASNNIDLGGGAPIRRSNNGGSGRNTPYSRYSNGSGGSAGAGHGGYERRNYYGASPVHHNEGFGSPNGGASRYSTAGSSGSTRYNPGGGYSASNSSYSMGSQDRRGFALPDRHTDEYAGAYADHHSASRASEIPYGGGGGGYRADDMAYGGRQRRTPGYGNGEQQQYNQLSISPYPYDQGGYAGQSSSQGASALNGYNRRPLASGDGSSASSASYGRSSFGSASGFNQDFPPLGSSSSVNRSYPSGPQTSRRDPMPNSRY